jgi:adenylate cyclase
MADENFKRKLTAILSADVEGYSRLMDDDEEATVRTLTTYRNSITDLTQQFRGRVVDSPGDNILAEFTSVVDAVNCAVEIQRDIAEKNAELPYERKMEFRIGVNLGDVIEEDGRIYGDGVNIAARVESLAKAGEICISGRAYDQVENKLGLDYENKGEHQVKNIRRPIRVYRVMSFPGAAAHRVVQAKEAMRRKWRKATLAVVVVLLLVGGGLLGWNYYQQRSIEAAVALFEKESSFSLPDKPSIAVLPFDNLSGDQEQEYFADGMMDSIITNLYKLPGLFVIAKTSSLAYKGKAVKVQQVARELGVRYLLEGSVQKASDRMRINIQLIDAVTGNHLWAEIYDRKLEDVFAVQDEITRNIVTEMGVKLGYGEVVRTLRHATDNYEALGYYYQADKLYQQQDKESNIQAQEMLMKAIKLDPKFARAFAFLGWLRLIETRFGWSKNPTASIKQAEELANQALAIDDKVYSAYCVLSHIYAHTRLYDQSIEAGKQAVECEPNNAVAFWALANTMILADRPGEGLVQIRKAMRLCPYPPSYFLSVAGHANYLTGRFEAAITEYKKYLKQQQEGTQARIVWLWLIASYMEMGREKGAKAEVKKLVVQNPNLSIEAYTKGIKRTPFKNYAFLDRQIDHLRKAGLPE